MVKLEAEVRKQLGLTPTATPVAAAAQSGVARSKGHHDAQRAPEQTKVPAAEKVAQMSLSSRAKRGI